MSNDGQIIDVGVGCEVCVQSEVSQPEAFVLHPKSPQYVTVALR